MKRITKTDKKVYANTAYQILGKVITSGLGVFSVIILSRYLGVVRFGEYNFVISFVMIAYLLADFGLNVLVTRAVSQKTKKENDKLVSHVVALRLNLSLLTFIGLIVVISFLSYTQVVKLGILVMAAGYILLQAMSAIWAAMQGYLQFGKYVAVQIATAVVQFMLILLFVWMGLSLIPIIATFTISQVIAILLTLRLYGRNVSLDLPGDKAIELLRRGLPFAVGVLVTTMYFRIDTLILANFFDPSELKDVGLYTFAYRPFEVSVMLANFYAASLFPVFSKLYSRGRLHKRVLRYGLVAFLIAATGLGLLYGLAPIIVDILGGHEFRFAVEPLRILSFALIPTTMGVFFSTIAIAGFKERSIVVVGAIALIVNLLLNYIYIPQLSYLAASWVTVITQVIMMVGNGVIAYGVLRRSTEIIADR